MMTLKALTWLLLDFSVQTHLLDVSYELSSKYQCTVQVVCLHSLFLMCWSCQEKYNVNCIGSQAFEWATNHTQRIKCLRESIYETFYCGQSHLVHQNKHNRRMKLQWRRSPEDPKIHIRRLKCFVPYNWSSCTMCSCPFTTQCTE